MKTATGTAQALLDSGAPFEQFDLYTFTLQVGLVLRYANCPFDVITGGHTFICSKSVGGIVIDEAGDSGPRGRWTSGFDVGTWSVAVLPRSTDLLGSLPWLSAIRAGLLDEATVRVDRAYVAAWPDPPSLTLVPAGTVNVFFGRIAEIDFGRSSVQITMNDMRELLSTDMPRNVYSAQCRYALFDVGCTLTKASFAVNATINGVAGNELLNTTATGQADDYFSLGEILFTSGGNNGLRQMIRQSRQSGGQMSLIAPMPFTVMNGDTVTLFPGCDKTVSTCTAKFSNVANFGGEPWIPAAETAL